MAFLSRAIESSADQISKGFDSQVLRGRIYHVARSRRERGDPWRGYFGDGNPVAGCWDHGAHRRRDDTWLPRQTVVVSECIPEGQR